MKNFSKSHKYMILAALSLLVAALACTYNVSDDESDDAGLQQTLVAMQQTQTALENQIAMQTLESEQPEEIIPPTEVVVEPVETATEEPDVIYEGISFSIDPNIAMGAYMETIPEQNMGEEFMPMETYPTHYEFTFDSYAVDSHFHTPRILVYPVEEYRAISPSASDTIDALKQALISRPSGGEMSSMPFLPIWNAAQIFAAKVSYFDFQNGSGVRFLTMFGQALYPVDNQNLFYTYQGITTDGRFYIAAILPVTHTALPYEGQVADWMAFEQNWDNYISETLTWMEGASDDSFLPSLLLLDEMMASFRIDR